MKTKSGRGRQLRNGDSDIAALTQWVGRKCRNHNPAAEMTSGKRSNGCTVGIVNDEDQNQVVYEVGGRKFKLEVTEITDTEEDFSTIPVGY